MFLPTIICVEKQAFDKRAPRVSCFTKPLYERKLRSLLVKTLWSEIFVLEFGHYKGPLWTLRYRNIIDVRWLLTASNSFEKMYLCLLTRSKQLSKKGLSLAMYSFGESNIIIDFLRWQTKGMGRLALRPHIIVVISAVTKVAEVRVTNSVKRPIISMKNSHTYF